MTGHQYVYLRSYTVGLQGAFQYRYDTAGLFKRFAVRQKQRRTYITAFHTLHIVGRFLKLILKISNRNV